jgi:hypothetical protein
MSPKVLTLILSCVEHELNGFNQAMRDTWLRHIWGLGLDYKFFIGNGSQTGEDETLLLNTYATRAFPGKVLVDPNIYNLQLRDDHVILDVPDDYLHVSYKFREACRWALSQGYDYIFQVVTDTFVVPSRLMASRFEYYDYLGTANSERTAIGGGPGFWLSRKAMGNLMNAPVTHWCSDGWVGDVMARSGIKLTHDPRYTSFEQADPPMKGNSVITSHIANTPTVYDPKIMYKLYRGMQ